MGRGIAEPIVNSDAALDLESLIAETAPALRGCMSVPLLAGDTLAGVLTLYSSSPQPFTEDRGRLLQMIAPHVAGAIVVAQRNAAAPPDVAERPAGNAARDLRLVRAYSPQRIRCTCVHAGAGGAAGVGTPKRRRREGVSRFRSWSRISR